MHTPVSAQKTVTPQANANGVGGLKAVPQVDNRSQTAQLRGLQAAIQRRYHQAAQNQPALRLSAPKPSKLPQALSKCVVQRKPLGIYSHDPDHAQLDTDDMVALGRYITVNSTNDRQDLNRLLVELVRQKDRTKLSQVQTLVHNNNKDDSLVEVPRTIHMIWVGDGIKDEEVANITSIHSKLPAGWKLNLWTDEEKCGFLATENGGKLQSLTEDGKFFINRNLAGQVDERVRETYNLALLKTAAEDGKTKKGGFTMMSDLGRYSILLKEGGVYMDTDLDLGIADLNTWDMRMSNQNGIPAFGPNIQFIMDMEHKLMIDLNTLSMMGELTANAGVPADLASNIKHAFNKTFVTQLDIAGDTALPQTLLDKAQDLKALESDDALSVKTRIATYGKYLRGDLNNNFVAVPARHGFMDSLLDTIKQGLAAQMSFKSGDFDPENVASYTGPCKLSTAIGEFYKTRGERVPQEGNITKKALMNPQWVSQIAQVGWLTGVHKKVEEKRLADVEEKRLQALAEQTKANKKSWCTIL